MTIVPPCFECRHFDRQAISVMRCKAFPVEIPDAIAFGEHVHREPYPGDNGIRFEPIAEESQKPLPGS